jgi:cyclophilin family peptidyl-prolyl cis-trans isomerase
VPSRKSRERQLAKLAARRAAERRRRRRRRILALSVGAAVAVAGVGGALYTVMRGGGRSAAARPTPTASVAPVACGGSVPAAASVPKPTFRKPPPMRIDLDRTYTAVVRTSCGTIRLRLFPKQAPLAVNSFVFLARKGFYDGLTFHRVVRNFVIQAGDPKGNGTGGPGYHFRDELRNNLRYEVGTLAMANSGPNTNGSQWFIVAGREGTTLPKRYTIFGRVVGGLDVVRRIDDLPTRGGSGADRDRPLQTVYIEKITILVSA